jgi:hypothetical protein
LRAVVHAQNQLYESSTFGTRVDVPGGMITEIAG